MNANACAAASSCSAGIVRTWGSRPDSSGTMTSVAGPHPLDVELDSADVLDRQVHRYPAVVGGDGDPGTW
jgi:hypothetical protein